MPARFCPECGATWRTLFLAVAGDSRCPDCSVTALHDRRAPGRDRRRRQDPWPPAARRHGERRNPAFGVAS